MTVNNWNNVMASGSAVKRSWGERLRRWSQDRLTQLGARIGSHPGTDESMMAYAQPPAPGQWRNLVAGECRDCGWHAVMPEGHTWPYCPNCGIRVMPPSGFHPDSARNRYGYAARYDEERKVVDEQVSRLAEADPL